MIPWFCGALAILILVEVVGLVPHPAVILLVLSGLWMAVPGVMLLRRVFAAGDPSGIAAALMGPAFGFGFSVFGVFLFWALGLHNWIAIVLGPALTWLLVWIAQRFGGPTLRMPAFDRRDLVAAALVLAIVPLVTLAPYRHVRARARDGEAYRAYFTADFIWAMSVSSEIAKGHVPPRNPFLNNEPLHYYWMAHFLSGALYRNVSGLGVTVEQVVLIDGLMFGLMAAGFLYALVRLVGPGPPFSALAVAAAFLANSYEGADMIRAIASHHGSWAELKNVNIDAVTRWFYKGMPVDGLQRLLLYQPHHLTGYMLALAALWLVALAEDVRETSVALWAGILLAMTLIFSTFTALIMGMAIAPPVCAAPRAAARASIGDHLRDSRRGAVSGRRRRHQRARLHRHALRFSVDPAAEFCRLHAGGPHAALRVSDRCCWARSRRSVAADGCFARARRRSRS